MLLPFNVNIMITFKLLNMNLFFYCMFVFKFLFCILTDIWNLSTGFICTTFSDNRTIKPKILDDIINFIRRHWSIIPIVVLLLLFVIICSLLMYITRKKNRWDQSPPIPHFKKEKSKKKSLKRKLHFELLLNSCDKICL